MSLLLGVSQDLGLSVRVRTQAPGAGRFPDAATAATENLFWGVCESHTLQPLKVKFGNPGAPGHAQRQVFPLKFQTDDTPEQEARLPMADSQEPQTPAFSTPAKCPAPCQGRRPALLRPGQPHSCPGQACGLDCSALPPSPALERGVRLGGRDGKWAQTQVAGGLGSLV